MCGGAAAIGWLTRFGSIMMIYLRRGGELWLVRSVDGSWSQPDYGMGETRG